MILILASSTKDRDDEIEPTVEIEKQGYREDEDFRVFCESEPRRRSQYVKVRLNGRVWWVRVTFAGGVLPLKEKLHGNYKKQKLLERRDELREFILLLDFGTFSLLDNTVTSIVFTLTSSLEPANLVKVHGASGNNSNNVFIDYAAYFEYEIREGSQRVLYPLCSEFPYFQRVHLSDISDRHEIAEGRVFRVRLCHIRDIDYVYKTVDWPLHNPMDTEVICEELRALERVRNFPHIRLLVLWSPQTNMQLHSQTTSPLFVTGILLGFYGGGSLKGVFAENSLDRYDWQKLTIQIGTALRQLHDIGRTHMDIKPSNVVLDLEGNAILVDIGGLGVTCSWLSPEFQHEVGAASAPLEMRRLNDVWTYGKLLLEMAGHITFDPFAAPLRQVGGKLMQKDPASRLSLTEAIRILVQVNTGYLHSKLGTTSHTGPFIPQGCRFIIATEEDDRQRDFQEFDPAC